MKLTLLEYLACPDCHGSLRLEPAARDDEEILSGALGCARCEVSYAIRGGVPRFVTGSQEGIDSRTARAFGWEWQVFARIDHHHEQQFLDWIAPADPATFRDRVVLEGGCGKGRHTRLAAQYGARAVIGVDLSDAVDVAYRNTANLPNAHIIQADLLRLPLRPARCDYAFSVGVLHHLPEPTEGFRSLAAAVRPGGELSVWVYGAENNRWVSGIVSPLRVAVTSRLPARVLYWLSMLIAFPLWLLLITAYRLAGKPAFAWMRRFLFYYPYLGYVSRFPFREIHHIVHDHLAAPVAHYLRREEVLTWYRGIGVEDPVIAWHNRNSWRGFGVLPGLGAASGEAAPGGPR